MFIVHKFHGLWTEFIRQLYSYVEITQHTQQVSWLSKGFFHPCLLIFLAFEIICCFWVVRDAGCKHEGSSHVSDDRLKFQEDTSKSSRKSIHLYPFVNLFDQNVCHYMWVMHNFPHCIRWQPKSHIIFTRSQWSECPAHAGTSPPPSRTDCSVLSWRGLLLVGKPMKNSFQLYSAIEHKLPPSTKQLRKNKLKHLQRQPWRLKKKYLI